MKSEKTKKLIEEIKAYVNEKGGVLESCRIMDPDHLRSEWYGGTVATLKYNGYTVEVNALGDVEATLLDEAGNFVVDVKDRNNAGAFAEVMRPYIHNDEELESDICDERMLFSYNNWFEVFVTDPAGRFHDLMWDLDNYTLDEAIKETADLFKELVARVAEDGGGN